MNIQSRKLYIVDDDIQICDLIEAYLGDEFNIVTYQDPRTFLSCSLNDEDILLLDLQMPDIDGVEVIRELAQDNKNSPLILMSGCDEAVLHSSSQLAKEYGLNVVSSITKPIDFSCLIEFLNKLVKHNCDDLSVEQDIISDEQQFNNCQSILLSSSKTSPKIASDFIPTVDGLNDAIKNDQLVLFYQPQINIKQGTVIGAEALVRWVHPDHGLVFPDKFIPLAEKSGVIAQLTERVINLAIAQLKVWHQQGRALKISINISAQNITSLSLPEQLTRLVTDNEIEPSMLMLEITESALMSELTTSLNILTRLRLKGFQLSIDDFGTGYSSLSQLHRVPFTELKIDRSFVSGMSANSESKAIVDTCILLGHKLNMEVIAEGVEDRETLDILQALGCDNAQGYFISKPLPIDEFEKWLSSF